MVLRNFIEIEDGQHARLHLTDHDFVDKEIRDPLTMKPKIVTALYFQVDRLDGVPVSATWSIIQEKLAAMLEPWLKDHAYRDVEFIVTRRGLGFTSAWTVEPSARSSR